MLRADLTVKNVPAPVNHWCRSGHVAPATFRIDGPGTEAKPTRFFQVSSGRDPNVNGTYCELCLILSNDQARRIKMEMKHG